MFWSKYYGERLSSKITDSIPLGIVLLRVNTRAVLTLIEPLATELERPRELKSQVVRYLNGNYSVDEDSVGAFLVHDLPNLEDYEIDLILSPVFTPTLADQAVFAQILGGESIPRERWPAIVSELAARPTRARLITSDRQTHSIPLREVTIERYVNRLRLEATIPQSLWPLIELTSAADHPLLKAIARRAIWESEGRYNILLRYLTVSIGRNQFDERNVLALLNTVENYKPVDTADMLAHIQQWQEALRKQVEVFGAAKPFFMQQIQEMHGGERDHRQHEIARLAAKQQEFDFLVHLAEVFSCE